MWRNGEGVRQRRPGVLIDGRSLEADDFCRTPEPRPRDRETPVYTIAAQGATVIGLSD